MVRNLKLRNIVVPVLAIAVGGGLTFAGVKLGDDLVYRETSQYFLDLHGQETVMGGKPIPSPIVEQASTALTKVSKTSMYYGVLLGMAGSVSFAFLYLLFKKPTETQDI